MIVTEDQWQSPTEHIWVFASSVHNCNKSDYTSHVDINGLVCIKISNLLKEN